MTIEHKRMQQLRGTSAEWVANDITPFDGEIAVERAGSGPRIKLGDGVTAYSDLPYLLQGGESSILDLIPPELHAGIRDGSDTTDHAPWFSQAFVEGGLWRVPAGYYNLDSTPTTATTSTTLRGDGEDSSVLNIRHGGARALYFVMSSPNYHVEVTGFTFQAANPSGQCPLGIDIEFPDVASYPYRQVNIADIRFQSMLGSTGPTWAGMWGRGLRLRNVWYADINGVNGSSAPIPGTTASTGFLELVGGTFASIAASINNSSWSFGGSGILCSGYTEGMRVSNFEFVGVTRGINVPDTTPLGGSALVNRAQAIWLSNGHIAAHSANIEMDTVQDVTATDMNMQRWPDVSATGWVGYRFNQVQYPQIRGGTIAGNEVDAAIGTIGIWATGNLCAHGIVTGVHFENLDSQFTLDAVTTLWVIHSNRSTGTRADVYSLSGTHHDVRWLSINGTIVYRSDNLNGPIATGSYTPTFTPAGNVDAASGNAASYMIVGNTVTVFGVVAIDPTTVGAASQVDISLPIPSDFTANEQCAGSAAEFGFNCSGTIWAEPGGNKARLAFHAAATVNDGWSFHFSYVIV